MGARAEEERARLAYSSNIEGVNTTVARLRAELSDAQWDLEQTVTRSPTAGSVTQVALRPGMYVVPAPLRPAMVFVNTDERAELGRLSAKLSAAGESRDEAEVAFDAVPSRVFKGKVRLVLDAIAAGQIQATGALVDFGTRTAGGRALAVIDIQEKYVRLPDPARCQAAQVAIYTEHWEHVSLLRKILLRMRSWQSSFSSRDIEFDVAANAGAERAARRLGCPAFNRTQPDIVSRRSARGSPIHPT